MLAVFAMDNLIKSVLRDILPSVEFSKLSQVADALITAGIQQESDLCWVTAEDIQHLLPPVQVRKLIGILQLKYSTGMH